MTFPRLFSLLNLAVAGAMLSALAIVQQQSVVKQQARLAEISSATSQAGKQTASGKEIKRIDLGLCEGVGQARTYGQDTLDNEFLFRSFAKIADRRSQNAYVKRLIAAHDHECVFKYDPDLKKNAQLVTENFQRTGPTKLNDNRTIRVVRSSRCYCEYEGVKATPTPTPTQPSPEATAGAATPTPTPISAPLTLPPLPTPDLSSKQDYTCTEYQPSCQADVWEATSKPADLCFDARQNVIQKVLDCTARYSTACITHGGEPASGILMSNYEPHPETAPPTCAYLAGQRSFCCVKNVKPQRKCAKLPACQATSTAYSFTYQFACRKAKDEADNSRNQCIQTQFDTCQQTGSQTGRKNWELVRGEVQNKQEPAPNSPITGDPACTVGLLQQNECCWDEEPSPTPTLTPSPLPIQGEGDQKNFWESYFGWLFGWLKSNTGPQIAEKKYTCRIDQGESEYPNTKASCGYTTKNLQANLNECVEENRRACQAADGTFSTRDPFLTQAGLQINDSADMCRMIGVQEVTCQNFTALKKKSFPRRLSGEFEFEGNPDYQQELTEYRQSLEEDSDVQNAHEYGL